MLSSATLGGFLRLNLEAAGLCSNGHPVRKVTADIPALIARYGEDAKTRDVLDRVVCSECRQRVRLTISSRSANEITGQFGAEPKP